MIVSHITLKNWRNFREADVDMGERMFLAGPNACGKSNFLDVFRFLRDIARSGGGLQKAVSDRGGISKIRTLSARQNPHVEIEIHLANEAGSEPEWKYAIAVKQEVKGHRKPYLVYEQVWKGAEQILNRPDVNDNKDQERLTQTHLEQINANQSFRDIAKFLNSVLYLHLVPQLLRFPDLSGGPNLSDDPFGRNFLERVIKTPEKTRKKRLKKIEEILKIAVPQLKELTDIKDTMGIPHLEAVYEHWRPNAGKQREDQFSDGTLRLIGFFWSLMEGESLLLLEEPELSLNASIVQRLAAMIHRLQKQKKRQVILSTHSADLLYDKGIAGEEVLLLAPGHEGTKIQLASSIKEVRDLLESGMSIGEAALPRTAPSKIHRMQQMEFDF